jgi:pantetheine-phosphate adenylyltransferase
VKSPRKRALYPGSFDPVTFGHLDLIERAHHLFDEVHVAVAINTEKAPLFATEDRVEFLKQAVKGKRGIQVAAFDGLIVEHARALKVGTIIRGLRATSDFDYEFQMALTNRMLAQEIDTIFLMPSEKHFYLSSRLIKEIAQWGGDVSNLVPAQVQRALKKIW